MDWHTLDFLSNNYHGLLVVDFYQQTQCRFTPLSELMLPYEPNQDMEMMLNKQLSISSTKLLQSPTSPISPMK
jgi:hypothetical protein